MNNKLQFQTDIETIIDQFMEIRLILELMKTSIKYPSKLFAYRTYVSSNVKFGIEGKFLLDMHISIDMYFSLNFFLVYSNLFYKMTERFIMILLPIYNFRFSSIDLLFLF